MTQEHPITPPPDLIRKWAQYQAFESFEALWRQIATQAARWGADMELEACCADLRMVLGPDQAAWLGSVRRPKPPSLKELALDALAAADGADHPVVATVLTADQHALIRKALEQLDD